MTVGSPDATRSRRVLRVLASHAAASIAMSLPWPLLLVMVWRDTASDAWLGVAAASRMAPYVVLSWWVARLADHMRRDRLVRLTLAARTGLLAGVAWALAGDRTTLAVVLCTLAVAVATPAYPALAAGMPRLAGADSRRATDLLVTVEVASFVVGPAAGGLLLTAPSSVGPASVAGAALAWALYAGIRQPRPATMPADVPAPRRARGVGSGAARSAALGGRRGRATSWLSLSVLAVVNLVVAATGVALLPLAEEIWAGGTPAWSDASAYGLATGALGFGALGGPLLRSVGRALATRMARGLLVAAVALTAASGAPSAWWAVAPLLVVGAAAVGVEAAATELLQDTVPDHRRAGVLGLGDSVMVLAALLGALLAPPLAGVWGPRPVLWLLAVACLLGAPVVHRAVTRRRQEVADPAPGQPTTTPRSTTAVGSRSTERSASGSRG